MKALTLLITAAVLILSACDETPETPTWPDGSTLWVGGAYADTALSWSPFGDVLFFSAFSTGATRLDGTDGLTNPEERTF
ncbi:MAG: hypothetical protein GY852_05555, partial [bacterium]|nr:hypothetical protein [bacterium]